MTADVVAQLVQGAVALLLALVGGGISWSEIRKHGAETERRKQAERERDAANVRADTPPASVKEGDGILRLLRRRRRLPHDNRL